MSQIPDDDFGINFDQITTCAEKIVHEIYMRLNSDASKMEASELATHAATLATVWELAMSMLESADEVAADMREMLEDDMDEDEGEEDGDEEQ
jgi:hypothetical protein